MTSVEPGGIVVVRFASDGSERKLMAEYAPITKRDARSTLPPYPKYPSPIAPT